MENLKRGRLQIVVTTDLAARGARRRGRRAVVNSTSPTPEDYVHRIGRAGSIPTRRGDAFTLAGAEEQRHLRGDRTLRRPRSPARHAAGLRLPAEALASCGGRRSTTTNAFARARRPSRRTHALAGRQTVPLAGAPRRRRRTRARAIRWRPRCAEAGGLAPAIARVKPKGIAVKVNPVAKPVVKPVAKPVAEAGREKPAPKPVAKKPAARSPKSPRRRDATREEQE